MNFKGNLTKDITLSMYRVHQYETPFLTRNSIVHAMMLQEFLDWTNRQWQVTAFWRGEKYNKDAGGVSNSDHKTGTATDVSFSGKTKMDYVGKYNKYADKWFEICDEWSKILGYKIYGEFGLYPDFYHIGSHITYQKKHCKFDRRSGKTIYLN